MCRRDPALVDRHGRGALRYPESGQDHAGACRLHVTFAEFANLDGGAGFAPLALGVLAKRGLADDFLRLCPRMVDREGPVGTDPRRRVWRPTRTWAMKTFLPVGWTRRPKPGVPEHQTKYSFSVGEDASTVRLVRFGIFGPLFAVEIRKHIGSKRKEFSGIASYDNILTRVQESIIE